MRRQNSDQSDDCLANCVLNTCGDGIVKLTTEPELYNGALPLPSLEDCDDANANPNDGCDACTEQVWNPEPLFVTEVDLASGQFSRISDIDFDLADQMYVIDSNHEQIFKITGTTAQNPSGEISLVAGSIVDDQLDYYPYRDDGVTILFNTEDDANMQDS